MADIISSLWIGQSLSLMEQLSINSFLRNGHGYHLFAYEKFANVPSGAVLRDAAEILPASEIFCYPHGVGKGSVAAFANLFRYKLLLERGGWWADTDVVCLRPFDFDEPIVFASERNGGGAQVTNAILKLPPDHAAARQCFETASREDRAKLTWGKTGPHLLNRVVRELGLEQFVQPPEAFCPLDHWEWESLLSENSKLPAELAAKQSYAIHLWHEYWRRARLELNGETGRPQSTRLFPRLCRRLGFAPGLAANNTTPIAGLLRRFGPGK